MRIVIEPPGPSDLDALAQIYLDVRRQTMDWMDPATFSLADFFQHSAGETVLVARSGRHGILGFVSLWRPDDFIHMLYVSKPWQGRGVGGALLRALPDWPDRPYRLKCLVRNVSAQTFYRHHGFTVVGRGGSAEGAYAEMALPARSDAAERDQEKGRKNTTHR